MNLPLKFYLYFSWLMGSICAERTIRISAVLNQVALIPCETRSSLLDFDSRPVGQRHGINLILWYRNGISVPFYTVDGRALSQTVMDDYDAPMDHSMLTNAAVRHITNDTRMEMDFSKQTPLLRIRNVTETDQGLYRCRVEYSGQRTFSTRLWLTVIGPPVSLRISDSEGNQLEGLIGPYSELENLTLICTAYGGNPKPKVVWFRRKNSFEEMVDDSYETMSLEDSINGTISTVVNILRFLRLERDDYLAIYICRASTRFYYSPLVTSITIDMNLMPINVRIYTNQYHTDVSKVLFANEEAEFRCRTEGSKPHAKIEWFLDSQKIVLPAIQENNETPNCIHRMVNWNNNGLTRIRHGNGNEFSSDTISTTLSLSGPRRCKFLSIIESHNVNSTLSIIRFIPNFEDHNRILSCQASNPFITNHFNKISDNILLNIQYGPMVSLGISGVPTESLTFDADDADHLPIQHVTVMEKWRMLEFNCHIKANPWIDRVLWLRDGQRIDLSQWPYNNESAVQMMDNNQTLKIEYINRFQTGYYQCQAFNSINGSLSEIIKLNVAYVPECQDQETKYFDLKRNVPEKVDCQVVADPSINLTYEWSLISPWTATELPPSEELNSLAMAINNGGSSLLDVPLMVESYLVARTEEPSQVKSDDDDADEYLPMLLLCMASNSIGQQKNPCSFILHIHPGPPQKVANCTLYRSPPLPEDHFEPQWEINENHQAIVACIPGNDGGVTQTLHLIGFLSNEAWKKSWNDSWHGTTNSSSLKMFMEQIHSMFMMIKTDLNSSDDDANSHQYWLNKQSENFPVKKEDILWTLSAEAAPEETLFHLENFTDGQFYDLIVYARNSAGFSEPAVFFNLGFNDVNETDDGDDLEDEKSLFANSIKSRNWAYLRLKGLIVILAFLVLIALVGALIRNFLAITSSNDTLGTHSIGSWEAESRGPEEGQEEQLENVQGLISIPAPNVEQSDVQQTNATVLIPNDNPQPFPDTNEPAMESYHGIQNEHQVKRKKTGNVLRAMASLKRFLNRSTWNTSHYGTYDLAASCSNENLPTTSQFGRRCSTTTVDQQQQPQQEWNFLADDSRHQDDDDDDIIADISTSSNSSSSGRNGNGTDSNFNETTNMEQPIERPNRVRTAGRLARLFDRFRNGNNENRAKPSISLNEFVSSTRRSMANRSKEYVKNSNRFGSRRHSVAAEDGNDRNVELLYVFNKSLY